MSDERGREQRSAQAWEPLPLPRSVPRSPRRPEAFRRHFRASSNDCERCRLPRSARSSSFLPRHSHRGWRRCAACQRVRVSFRRRVLKRASTARAAARLGRHTPWAQACRAAAADFVSARPVAHERHAERALCRAPGYPTAGPDRCCDEPCRVVDCRLSEGGGVHGRRTGGLIRGATCRGADAGGAGCGRIEHLAAGRRAAAAARQARRQRRAARAREAAFGRARAQLSDAGVAHPLSGGKSTAQRCGRRARGIPCCRLARCRQCACRLGLAQKGARCAQRAPTSACAALPVEEGSIPRSPSRRCRSVTRRRS